MKIFVKADKDANKYKGPKEEDCALGFSWNYIRNCSSRYKTNTPSIAATLEKSWEILHELGHGFQIQYTFNHKLRENDLELFEVGNNFYAYEEQKRLLEEKNKSTQSGKIGILYELRNQEDYMNQINAINEFNDLESSETKLFIFENLFDKIDMKTAMSHTLRKYRDEVSVVKYENGMSNQDLFGKYFSEATNYNVIPYFNYFKIYPSKSIEDEVYANQQPIVYPIAYVFNEATGNQIAETLNLRGRYSTVSNEDVKEYLTSNPITRDVTFVITTDNINSLSNKKISIKSSKNETVASATINNDTLKDNSILVEDVPVGMYYLDISGGIDDIDYILINQDSSQLSVNVNYTLKENFDEVTIGTDTGVTSYLHIIIGMIFIGLGIGIIIYKKNENHNI